MEQTDSLLQRCFLGVVSSLFLDEDILFVGKGNCLSIYDTQNDKILSHLQVFESNKITNIKLITLSSHQKVLFVIAEKEIQYSFYDRKKISSFLHFKRFNTMTGEFCLDICLMNEYLCFGFMNNFIEIHYLTKKDDIIETKHVKTMFCNEKSIVYSLAFLSNEKEQSIIIGSGTVFRRIVLWEVSLKEKDNITIKRSLTLTGHGGVIFSVIFLDDSNTLISTSDDRTAILWEYDMDKGSFKSDTFFGHSARVWNASFNSKKSFCVSVSEDTTARIYDMQTKQLILELASGHYGKNIRSVVMNSNYIWTGAEDGQVIKWNYPQILAHQQSSTKDDETNTSTFITYKLDDNDSQCVIAKTKQHNFSPSIKLIYFLDDENILIGTNHGQVLNYSIDQKTISKILYSDTETRVINSIDVISEQYLLTGLSDGKVNLTDLNNLTAQKTLTIFNNIRVPLIKHKIFSHSKEIFLVISTALGKNMIIYYHDYTKLTFEILAELLSQKNPLVINSGIRFPKGISSMEVTRISKGHYNFFLGDYEGRLYYTSIQIISDHPFCFSGLKYLTIHNNDKITYLFFMEKEQTLYSLSRDGTFKKFCLIFSQGSFTIKELDAQIRKDMLSLENILCEKEDDFTDGKYYLVGHAGRKLQLYDNERNIIIHSHDVKGVHRPLDCRLFNGNLIYAYSQSEAMFLKTIPLHPISTNTNQQKSLYSYTTPLNGRLIHFTNIIHLVNDLYLITTSAEDTKVNFYLMNTSSFFTDTNDMIFLSQFGRHECSIRKTRLLSKQFTNSNDIIELVFISIASKSEALLFKIIINLLNKTSSFNFLCDLSMPLELNDTRNMDVAIYQFSKNNKTFIAFTNTIAITWCYIFDFSKTMFNYEDKKSIMNNKTNFIALCLNIICPDKTDDSLTLIHGLTNGNINLISYTQPETVNMFYKIHEAGVNDIKVFNDSFIISSGEDYSIIICQLTNLTELKVINKIQKLHFSAVKTIELIPIDEDKFSIISGSYDQIINHIHYDTSSNTWAMKRKIKACVAEINTISISRGKNKEILIIAAGQGIEVFQYNNI